MKKVLLVICLLLSLVGCSSNSAKYNVGVIQFAVHDALDNATNGFVDALKAEFGDDINIDVQNAGGDGEKCGIFANGFVADNVDLIMCNATPALQVAKNATKTIPILGTSVTEYGSALGIDNFNGVVGTNISGTSDKAPLDQQAQMLIDLLPNAKNIGIIYCTNEDNSIYQFDAVSEYLISKGLNVTAYGFSDTSTFNSVVDAAFSDSDAVFIPTDNTCADNGDEIRKIAEKKNKPIIAGEKSILDATGGLATLSIDYYELGKSTGEMAIRVLKGEENISEMEIEYYTKLVKYCSKSKAEKFGITIPSDYVEID